VASYAEQVSFKDRKKASSSFTHLGLIKLGFHSNVQSVLKQFSIVTWLQKSVATKLYVKIGRMSNQRKAEFINVNFYIQVSGEVMVKFCQNPDLWQRVKSVQKLWNSAIRPTSNSRNSEIADRLESWNEPSKDGESYLMEWYSEIREFQISLVIRILFFQLLCCPEQFSTVLAIHKIS
jgi:hypothetical protein